MIIAIDGPAGSGKSTIAKLLAGRFNIEYIDSGAIYRSFTLLGMQRFENNCEGHEEEIAALIRNDPELIQVSYEAHVQVMWLQGENVNQTIRDPNVTSQVKFIADSMACRELVNEQIRRIAKNYSVVIDGRDIGTIVFPDAPYKFYLDAQPVVRARRRAKEYGIAFDSEEFQTLLDNINMRDRNDMERTIAPLKKAEDAHYIDTSDLSISEVLTTLSRFLP